MRYQTHWRFAFLIAFFFHIVAWLFLMVLIPHVFKHIEQPPPDEPMEWVELADGDGPPEEEQQPEEPPPPPPPPPPEPVEAEEEPAVVEAEIPEEATTALLKEAEDSADKPEEEHVLKSGDGKQIAQPGKILHAEQPAYGVIPFKGRIAVSAHIGMDGRVMWTKIKISSGNLVYDRLARRIVEKQWKFEPAKDMNGQPVESNMQCPVYFNMKPARNIK